MADLPDQLYNGALDAIFTYNFSLFDKPDLVTVPIETFSSCIMLNKQHPLADKPDLKLSDLKDEIFFQLKPEASEEGYLYINNLCIRSGFHPNLHHLDKLEDVLLWVQSGAGVAITSDRSIERFNPQITIRPTPKS